MPALNHSDRSLLMEALADSDVFLTSAERRMFVRNALAGYPMSGEIQKALRYVNWEGKPIVVAEQALGMLDGHEAAPGVPAFALLAEALEPISRTHRAAVADLRHRAGWTAAPSSVTEPAKPHGDPPAKPVQVFLCHASEDKAPVRDLYRRLKHDGFQPWLDEEDLLPGQNWDWEIRHAVRLSDAVVICLTGNSILKRGYLQKEIRFALDVAD